MGTMEAVSKGLMKYDPHTGTWRTLPDAPHKRDHFHAAVVRDKLYAIGGRRSSKDSNYVGDQVKEVDIYDFTLGVWLTSGLPDDLPTPRSGAAVAAFDGKIMIMGGESDAQPTAYKSVDALDTVTGKWSTLAPMNYPRHGTQAIVSGQGVFVTAVSPVQTNGRQKNMEVYNANNPAGIASVAGLLSAPSGVDLSFGNPKDVVIKHVGGNEGVLLESVTLTGPNQSDFRYLGSSDPILIGRDGETRLQLEYMGSLKSAQAQLVVKYSGGNMLTVALAGTAVAVITAATQNTVFLDTGFGDASFFTDNSTKSYRVSDSVEIKGTSTPQYFRTHRWSGSSFKYVFSGYNPGKTYEVKLGFAEVHTRTCTAGVGARVFNVVINKRVVELDMDVFAAKGCETAFVESYYVQPASGGILEIEFVPKRGNAMVSYMKIEEASGSTPSLPGPTSSPVPPPTPSPLPPPTPPPTPSSTPSSAGSNSVFIDAGSTGENMTYVLDSDTKSYSKLVMVSGTSTPQFFRSHRFKGSSFSYKIGGFDRNKMYKVELGFAELYGPNCAAGIRVFDVEINGNVVKSNLDVFAAKGCETAYTMSYDLPPNTSGAFVIKFIKKSQNPMVSFIKLEQTTGGSKPPPTAPPPTALPPLNPPPPPPPTPLSTSRSFFADARAKGESTSEIFPSNTMSYSFPGSYIIRGTSTPGYFRSHRYHSNSFGYKINGYDRSKTYKIDIGFAEQYTPNCEIGKRVFDVIVNGATRESNLDVYAAKGCETAFVLSYTLLPSSLGSFEVIFSKE